MKINLLLPLIFIYFITRLPFLRLSPVFYDSFEYVRITEKIDFFNLRDVLLSSHQPVHTFYFLLILLFKKLFFFWDSGTIPGSIPFVSGLFTVIIFFKILSEYISRKSAFFAALTLLFFPYFFMVNTNIFYESPLLFLQIFSFYLLTLSFKKKSLSYLIGSGVSLGLSVSVFIGSLIIFPLYLLIVFLNKNGKPFFKMLIFYATAVFTPLLIDLLIYNSPVFIYEKFKSHAVDVTSASGGLPVFVLRALRNIFVQYSAILSWPGLILGLIAVIFLIKRRQINYKPVIFLFFPAFVLSQYWHAGLYGRLILYIIFPVAYLLTLFYQTKLSRILVLSILMIFCAKFMLQQKLTPPIYRYFDLYSKNAAGHEAIITSDYNRFLYERINSNLFVINGGGINPEKFRGFINENLEDGADIIIDSAALSYPYFQYDGNSYHILSKNRRGIPFVNKIMEQYETKIWAQDTTSRDIYFLKLTIPSMADRIKKLKSAYD